MYLAVYVQANPLNAEEAVVISMGEQSFTVNIPRLGVTDRLYLDKIPDVHATYNEGEGVLHLEAASTVTHDWTYASIKIFSKIVVRCAVVAKGGPIGIQLEFVRPLMGRR